MSFSFLLQHEKEQPAQQSVKSDQVTIRHRSELMGDIDESEGYMRNKWSEQEMIQTRRSVSSSPSSESENNEAQDESKHQQLQQQKMPMHPVAVTATIAATQLPTPQNEMPMSNAHPMRVNEMALNEGIQEMLPFPGQQQQSLPHPSGQMNQFNFPNENGPVSLFPPTSGSLNTQIPFPSPGTAMFPPTFVNAYSAASSTNSQQTSKPGDTLTPNTGNSSINYSANMCAAAFTSSSRNIALTTSMMAPSPVQSDVSQIASPNSNNMQTPIPPHVTGNNNNNNISNPKMDFNRRKYKKNITFCSIFFFIGEIFVCSLSIHLCYSFSWCSTSATDFIATNTVTANRFTSISKATVHFQSNTANASAITSFTRCTIQFREYTK